MPITLFYSWQSDCPNSTNRTFIEDALEKAIKAVSTNISIENAERNETLVLDRDTQGVPGTPPITDVIFQKISGAAIFVPDLTFVGKAENNRLIPNPNVLIEYGYAIRALGYPTIVPIMNTAYGKMTQENLPFNMRHLRHPLTYHLANNANSEDKKKIKSELIKNLIPAIELILNIHSAESPQQPSTHLEIPYTQDPSTFLKKDEPLGFLTGYLGKPDLKLVVPENEHLFLRIIPKIRTDSIPSGKKAQVLMNHGNIRPFTDNSLGWSQGFNKLGAFVAEHENGNVFLYCPP